MVSPKKSKRKVKKSAEKTSQILLISGLIASVLALSIIASVFAPVIREEIRYRWHISRATLTAGSDTVPAVLPVDPAFSIIIPKLAANAKIISTVNPYDSREYQQALTRGVAHARGSAFPGEQGNVFLFSHSSVNFYEATRYNSVFYLIDKLEPGDSVTLYYLGKPYIYTVTGKKLVSPTDVSYLTDQGSGKTLSLMTCWPAGTTLKRLLVFARQDTP